MLSATDLQPMAPRRLTTGGWLVDLAVSPDGAYLASLGSDGDLLLWGTASWQPLGQPVSDENGWGFLGFDPDRRTLRAVHQDGTVLTFLVDPAARIRQACVVANRDLTPDESQTIRPRATSAVHLCGISLIRAPAVLAHGGAQAGCRPL